MTVRFLTWADRGALRDDPTLDGAVQLFATNSLRRAYLDEAGDGRASTCATFLGALKRILDPWFGAGTELSQLARLTEVLRDGRDDAVGRSFLRSRRDVLEVIRTLVLAGLAPSALDPVDVETERLVAAWRGFESAAPGLSLPRERLYGMEWSSEQVLTAFRDAIDEVAGGSRPGDSGQASRCLARTGTLVLPGYYYVTPEQHRLLSVLHGAGIDLVFLSWFDPRFPSVFRIWNRTFDGRSPILPAMDDWHLPAQLGEVPERARRLGDVLSGAAEDAILEDPVPVLSYDSLPTFVEDRETTPHEVRPRLYSPDSENLGRALRDFLAWDEPQDERHLLSYPVGQLLLRLHSMWDAERQDLFLDPAGLREAFGSGLLRVGDLDGRDYLEPLDRLLPFFGDCDRLSEWEDRLALLEEIHEDVLSGFPVPVPFDHPRYVYHRTLAMPLLRLSWLSVPPEDARAVVGLVRRLASAARELLGEENVSLAGHFRRLRELLLEGPIRSGTMEEEERLILGADRGTAP